MLVKSAKTGKVKSIDMTDTPVLKNVTVIKLNTKLSTQTKKRKGLKKL